MQLILDIYNILCLDLLMLEINFYSRCFLSILLLYMDFLMMDLLLHQVILLCLDRFLNIEGFSKLKGIKSSVLLQYASGVRTPNKDKLKIIEDSAQAHGAYYNERRTGNLGDASGFSFYPGKNLGCMASTIAIYEWTSWFRRSLFWRRPASENP